MSLFDHWSKIKGLLCILLMSLAYNPAYSQSYPAGFSQVLVAGGLSGPTNMTFAPDGRIFVCEKAGKVKIIKNGLLLSTPFLTISVNSAGERGLLGLAFDPNFNTNHYVYLYYTISSGANNRISRFTANGDLAVTNSEVVLLNTDPLSTATNHNGGTIKFGPDGKLYVAIGENTNSQASQNLNTRLGKLLRLNTDGTPAAGNPYYSNFSAAAKAVWCLGLRNPYTFDFDNNTGKLFINDVGSNSFEEINDGTSGDLNFGWPATEGMSGNASYTNPVFAYAHGITNTTGCAISGGTFFNGSISNYPTQYSDKYFFIDYCNSWINFISTSGGSSATNFATSLQTELIALEQGTDGNLYFLSRSSNNLYKIVYFNNTAPVIITQPVGLSVSVGQPATFSVTVSGASPISYKWKKNGTTITNATSSTYSISSVTSASAGNYSCVASNSYGSVTSNTASLVVTPYNAPPVASIISPASNSTYSGGNTINYSGSATDPEDGTLPASAFQWEIVFFHDAHNHPGPSGVVGAKSGSFTVPNMGETSPNVFYRIYLYVKDSKGLTDTAYVDVTPRLTNITINSAPTGLLLKVEGQDYTTPAVISSVEGVYREIIPVSPQTLPNGDTYDFASWSNGSGQTLSIVTPVNDVTYTTTFVKGLRDPENPLNPISGLHYQYFEGAWSKIPDFSLLLPVKEGSSPNFDLSTRNRNDNFAYLFQGYVDVPANGTYTFYTSSDDGSRLYIGNTLVVNNDGLHANLEVSGTIGLKAGRHALTVQYFEATGQEVLNVKYSGPNLTKQAIPSAALFQESITLELLPIADAYIRSGAYANQNFGNTNPTKLEVKKGSQTSNVYRVSLLKFDISGIANSIVSANLYLYGNLTTAYPQGLNIGAWKIPNTSWNESYINWNNAPTLPTNLISSVSMVSEIGQTYAWDVSSFLEERRIAGYEKMTIALSAMSTSSTTTAVFNSKESTSIIPRLVVVLDPNILAFAKGQNSAVLNESDMVLYPVPSNEVCNVLIKAKDVGNFEYQLTNIEGKIIDSQKMDANYFSIDTSNFPSGLYVVRIVSAAGVITKKFMVEH